jgi:hypothetical protein
MKLLQIIPMPIITGGGGSNPGHLTKLLITIFLLGVIGVFIAATIALVKTLKFRGDYTTKWKYFKERLVESSIFFFSTALVAVPTMFALGALIYNLL